MLGYLKGIPYITIWLASIFAGYAAIFCPLLPLILVSNKLYRNLTDFVLTFWQMYPAALLEFIYGTQIHVTGDAINSGDNILMIMNHRTRTDWNFLWPAVYQATYGPNRWIYPTKFVLKDPIRHLPGVGWMMQLGSYLYIKRNWEEDKVKMSLAIEFFANLGTKYCLMLFPEGTDLTPHTKKNSDNFADKHELPHYEYVLHPRATGFCYLAQKMQKCGSLDAIYDVTIIYSDLVPQNENSLIGGKVPRHVYVHFDRYVLPDYGSTARALQTFLEARWREKENTLRQFYTKDPLYRCSHRQPIKIRPSKRDLYIALVFWTMLPIPVTYALFTCAMFRYMVLAHTLFLLIINYQSDGFQTFEISIHNLRAHVSHYLALGFIRRHN